MFYPETPVNARREPDTMNKHLRDTWCELRNGIAQDQQGVLNSLDRIKACKREIAFFKNRIIARLNALEALEGVK